MRFRHVHKLLPLAFVSILLSLMYKNATGFSIYRLNTGSSWNSMTSSHAVRACSEHTESSPAEGQIATTAQDDAFSLVSSFLVEFSSKTEAKETVCSLIPLESFRTVDSKTHPSDGARSSEVLRLCESKESPHSAVTIAAAWTSPTHISISCSSTKEPLLVSVVARILMQWTLKRRSGITEATRISCSFPGEEDVVSYMSNTGPECVHTLFHELDDSLSEIVEMVDKDGICLGRIPRKLVHSLNILHRGIGIFVTRDKPIMMKSDYEQPDLYCHRRSEDKRIFPSLYDMFVGGVSLAGEEASMTALREVAEELGLTAGLSSLGKNTASPLSECLLRCLVCTAYNRCVVDLFSYSMNTENEKVTWQKEEVAWGSFVQYDLIEAAADRSIMRLATQAEWPGRYPPTQSQRLGEPPVDMPLDGSILASWDTFDFVPDGLLVWEAWLLAIQRKQHIS